MLEQGTFCFKYIPRMYGVFKAHLIQSRKEGSNALCLTGKQDTRALPQNFAENDTRLPYLDKRSIMSSKYRVNI